MDVDSQGTGSEKPPGAAEDHIPDISSFAEDDAAALDSASVPSDPVRTGRVTGRVPGYLRFLFSLGQQRLPCPSYRTALYHQSSGMSPLQWVATSSPSAMSWFNRCLCAGSSSCPRCPPCELSGHVAYWGVPHCHGARRGRQHHPNEDLRPNNHVGSSCHGKCRLLYLRHSPTSGMQAHNGRCRHSSISLGQSWFYGTVLCSLQNAPVAPLAHPYLAFCGLHLGCGCADTISFTRLRVSGCLVTMR